MNSFCEYELIYASKLAYVIKVKLRGSESVAFECSGQKPIATLI